MDMRSAISLVEPTTSHRWSQTPGPSMPVVLEKMHPIKQQKHLRLGGVEFFSTHMSWLPRCVMFESKECLRPTGPVFNTGLSENIALLYPSVCRDSPYQNGQLLNTCHFQSDTIIKKMKLYCTRCGNQCNSLWNFTLWPRACKLLEPWKRLACPSHEVVVWWYRQVARLCSIWMVWNGFSWAYVESHIMQKYPQIMLLEGQAPLPLHVKQFVADSPATSASHQTKPTWCFVDLARSTSLHFFPTCWDGKQGCSRCLIQRGLNPTVDLHLVGGRLGSWLSKKGHESKLGDANLDCLVALQKKQSSPSVVHVA